MRTLHYALIGCGMMGREHIRNILLLDRARIAAILDPDAAMCEAALQLAPDARLVGSLGELLAIDDLDCLVIASPNHQHAPSLQQIAGTRTLPILVEKPLYTDPADAAALADAMSRYPAPVWVAMEYRYMPPLAEFLRQVNTATGGVTMLTIREHRFPFLGKVDNWNRFNGNSGGTLVEKCCHFFDLMRLVIGAEPLSVMASAGQAHNHLDECHDGRVPDIWDHGYVIVNFGNGARAMLELCMFADGSTYQEEISAVGVDGKIECRIPGPPRFWSPQLGEQPLPQVVVSPRSPPGARTLEIPIDPVLSHAGDHHGATFHQHRRFQQVVLGEATTPAVSVDDGLRAVQIGLAAQRSAITGETVSLSDADAPASPPGSA